MSHFYSVLQAIRTASYSEKTQLLEYTVKLIHYMNQSGQSLLQEDRSALMKFCDEAVSDLLLAIPAAANYREKDQLFACADRVLHLFLLVNTSANAASDDLITRIQLLTRLIAKERYIEHTVIDLFKQDRIDLSDVDRLLDLANGTSDEFQKGMLYGGLLVNKAHLVKKLTLDARIRLAEHLAAEYARYLRMDSLTEDCTDTLATMAEVSTEFANDDIVRIFYSLLKLGITEITYQAAKSLIQVGENVPQEVLLLLAQNEEYAYLLYTVFKRIGKQDLFPRDYSSAEYLAKSQMIHWLKYPTELGKAPEEIEYIGKISYFFKKETYYVFKYRSDSHTLDEETRNKWLIGWASEQGKTFSNFDVYARYKKSTTAATLRNIKKKLIH